jgi:hypothetical protein
MPADTVDAKTHAKHILRARNGGNYFPFFRPYARLMNKLTALFLQDVLNPLSLDKAVFQEDDDGCVWFQCTAEFLARSTLGWTAAEQKYHLGVLAELGYVSVKRRGVPATRWVCLDLLKVQADLDAGQSGEKPPGQLEENLQLVGGKPPTSRRFSDDLSGEKPADLSGEKPPDLSGEKPPVKKYTERTTQKESPNTPPPPPPSGGGVGPAQANGTAHAPGANGASPAEGKGAPGGAQAPAPKRISLAAEDFERAKTLSSTSSKGRGTPWTPPTPGGGPRPSPGPGTATAPAASPRPSRTA